MDFLLFDLVKVFFNHLIAGAGTFKYKLLVGLISMYFTHFTDFEFHVWVKFFYGLGLSCES